MSIKEEFSALIKNTGKCPYLFIGSGFSRRYANLEDWEKLLRKYSTQEFGYYRSRSNGSMPHAATLIADDFFEAWWRKKKYSKEREKYKEHAKSKSFPLKASIADYLQDKITSIVPEINKNHELMVLRNAKIDGIVTTNWDCLLENIFPENRVFIGQEEMILSGVQSIGETFKIHGCVSSPDSMVLTQEDYSQFEAKNPYLAAKLLTIFVEHPVVFIGYSLQDSNIRSLLKAINDGVGSSKAAKIFGNMYFLNRISSTRPIGIHKAYIEHEKSSFEVTSINTDDFADAYSALTTIDRKIPLKILRACQDQFYQIVKSANPERRINIIDSNEKGDLSGVEFVIGVGVKAKYGDVGYSPIELADLFEDLLIEDRGYDPRLILDVTLAKMHSEWHPVFKYLNKIGILNKSQYDASGYKFPIVNKCPEDYASRSYLKSFHGKYGKKTLTQLINSFSEPIKASYVIPCMDWKNLKFEELQKYVAAHFKEIEKSTMSTYLRKIACIYDRIKYGWK